MNRLAQVNLEPLAIGRGSHDEDGDDQATGQLGQFDGPARHADVPAEQFNGFGAAGPASTVGADDDDPIVARQSRSRIKAGKPSSIGALVNTEDLMHLLRTSSKAGYASQLKTT